MTIPQILLLGLYVPLSCLLCLYGLHRAHMLFAYLRCRNDNPQPEGELKELPTVLIQVPVFNERSVVVRIMDAVAAIDYPRDKLRIQLLDDSTDDTVEISERRCAPGTRRRDSTSSISTARTGRGSRPVRWRRAWRSTTANSSRSSMRTLRRSRK